MSRTRVLALAVAGLLAGFALTTVAQRPAPREPRSSGAPVAGFAEDLARAAVGGTQDRQVVLTEAQVNQQIAQHLRENPDALPVREPQVRLRQDGRVDVRGLTLVAGRAAEIRAIVRLHAHQGVLDLEIESAQAASVPIPAIVAREIAERAAIAAGLSGLKGNALPDGIEAVAVEEGRLIITRR